MNSDIKQLPWWKDPEARSARAAASGGSLPLPPHTPVLPHRSRLADNANIAAYITDNTIRLSGGSITPSDALGWVSMFAALTCDIVTLMPPCTDTRAVASSHSRFTCTQAHVPTLRILRRTKLRLGALTLIRISGVL